MSEHALIAILGFAFTVAFLGGLLALTQLEEEEGQSAEQKAERNARFEEAAERKDQARRTRGSAERRRKLRQILDDGVANESEPEAKTAEVKEQEEVKGPKEETRQEPEEEETRQEPVDEEVGERADDEERMETDGSDEEAVGQERVERKNIPEQLRELARLREEGIVTEDEYEAKRKQLVDEL